MSHEKREHITGSDLARLYNERFTVSDMALKNAMWHVLCEVVFQQYVRPADTVLDLGAGTCEFINAIYCGNKIAVDLNPEIAAYTDSKVVLTPSTDMSPIQPDSVDVVFTSNFFEHLPDKAAVRKTLSECHRVLRTNGTIINLMPNIRYLNGRYWDYADHYTPLTHISYGELLRLENFTVQRSVGHFLPYTVKDMAGLPEKLVLCGLRLYLRLPVIWPIFGRQMLVVASANPSSVS